MLHADYKYVHFLSGDGGRERNAVRSALEKKSHIEWATHIHGIHQPFVNSRLKTFKKAILLLSNYHNPSNYEVNYGRSKSGPSNRHDSPVRFCF